MVKKNGMCLPRIGLLALAVHAAWSLPAFALPDGASVVNGQVALSRPAPGALQINASNGAIINWQQFSIGASESARFVQPSSSSAVLNRVVGPDMSQLLGQLSANGRVFLINPRGIVIGGGARIDTNSFIASTLDIADADFLAGKLRFLATAGAGRIRNDGVIAAGPNGRIALIAPDIENTGIIHAPDGNILLAAGRKLEIASLDLEGITFEIQAPTDSILNLGKLLADNGAVQAFAGSLRNSGEIRAMRMIQGADGSIVLSGGNNVTLTSDSLVLADGAMGGRVLVQSRDGTARVDGLVSATGSAGAGGDIRILGERVALESGAVIDASGSAGGGQILIGGDYQGGNALVQNAQRVSVADGASLRADATVQGDGGRIIVWADENTRYGGHLSARGGAAGGDGGFAEVSGKQNLAFTGTADLAASAGRSGSLLLDPLDILVSLTSGILPVVVDEFADFASNVVTVSPLTLAAVAGNVVLQAERHILVRDAIALSTAGAGITATAGGALFNVGSITNTAGITTNGGAVTLRASTISGPGGITTAGGAVDLMTASSLNYTGAIASAGGAVTLASPNSSVVNANVNAGSGAIMVTGRSISGGTYQTTGTAAFSATAGSINVRNGGSKITAGVADLTATSSINASVNVTDRVNATSTGSSVSVHGVDSGPLRLGSIAGNSGIYLDSSTGMAQASGGVLTSRYVTLYGNDAAASIGSQAAPIQVASPSGAIQPELVLGSLAAPAHVAFVGSPILARLELSGTVAGVGGSTVTGAGNLSTLSLGAGPGVLNVSAVSTAGLANGFVIDVTDGAINAATLTLPGAPVDLTSSAGVTVGTMSGASLSIDAIGAVSIGTATTTGSSGININTQSCYYYSYVACTANSPITAGTLDAGGTGDVNVYTGDNGDVSVTSLTGRNVEVSAGGWYPLDYYSYTSMRTVNNVALGTVVAGRSFDLSNEGQGNVTVGALSAGQSVSVQAGGTFSPTYNVQQRTTNTITVNNVEPVAATGDFDISNSGMGNVTLTGAVDRSASGSINLQTSGGSIIALDNLSARSAIDVTATAGGVSLGQVVSGSVSNNGTIAVRSADNLSFASLMASAPNTSSGYVIVSSSAGAVKGTVNGTANDIVASGTVSIRAAQEIGDATFANPLDIKAGADKAVTLTAGLGIGAAGRPVNVDTTGTIEVASSAGQFHVAAKDGVGEKSVKTIRLSASAGGIGDGNNATFTSADLDITATASVAAIDIGAITQANATLNEFKFAATGASALTFGNVNLATAGINKLVLTSTGDMTQTAGNVIAGNLNLDAGSGNVMLGSVTSSSAVIASPGANNIVRIRGAAVTAGNLSAQAVDVSGTGNVTLGSVTSTGTQRGYPATAYDNSANRYPLDELRLSAGGMLTTSANISSLTSALLGGGTGVSVNAGAGNVSGGNFNNGYYTDKVTIGSGSGTLAAGVIGAHDVTLTGVTLNTGNVTATRYLNVGGASTGSVTSGNLSGGSGLTLDAGAFATGNLTAANGALTITANATGPGLFVPSTAIAMTSGASVTITAANGIDLMSNSATLSAPTVGLNAPNGEILANLTNTTYLVMDTGGQFNVTSTGVLGTLQVTADGETAGAGMGSSVTAFDGTQAMTVLTTSGTLSLGLESGSSNSNFYYTERSANIADILVSTVGTFGSGAGRIDVSGNMANIAAQSVSTGGAALILNTDGNIALNSVLTAGGAVGVFSGNGQINLVSVDTGTGSMTASTYGSGVDILVQSVTTGGGDVYLAAYDGSLVPVGSGLHIDSRNGQLLASGTTTLSASNGSVGTGAAPILTSGAFTLDVTARDEIAVDVANTSLTNLAISAAGSGSGAVAVTGLTNFSGLGGLRSGGNLMPGAVTASTPGAFSLTATDGNIVVGGNIGNVTDLTLNAYTGDVLIQAAGLGAARNIDVSGQLSLSAGRDLLITAGSASTEAVAITASALQMNAGRDFKLIADGASVQVTGSGNVYSQSVSAGNDMLISGGSSANASASLVMSGADSYAYFYVARDLTVSGGSGTDAFAMLQNTNTYQQSLNVNGNLLIHGGIGMGAFAKVDQGTGSQYATVGGDLSVLGGDAASGQGTGAYAQLSGGYQDMSSISGNLVVKGGTADDNSALISSTSSQYLGTHYSSGGSATDSVSVLGGSGARAFARISAVSSQSIYAAKDRNNSLASGNITVMGGDGTDATAQLTSGADQNLGAQDNYCYYYCYDPTKSILVQGGTGSAAFASVDAAGYQSIYGGGDISVLGQSGPGAYAQIRSTGSGQQIGSTSTSSSDATDNILVQAGGGGIARILAQGSQAIMAGGNLSVRGGTGTNMQASIESSGGSQNIGYTYIFSNDPSGSILVQGGNASGAAAFVKAATGQTMDAGGTITIAGDAAGAYADVSTTAGTQTIGNVNGSSYDRTDSISLAGGSAAGSYARLATGGFQNLRTSADLALSGGVGDNSGALLQATTGQTLTVQGALGMVGGSGTAPGANTTAIRNSTSGAQTVNVTGNLSITGGGFGSDTWIKQDGTGNQTVNVGGNLSLLAPVATVSTGVTSIESLGPVQSIIAGGAISIDNQAGWLTYIGSTGVQNIDADALAISLSTASPVSAPFAGITAGGNQTINLVGDRATVGTATLSIANTSSLTDSSAAVSTMGNQTILMPYESAGLVQIGSTNGLGKAQMFSAGKLTMVAGQLLIQGGASAAAVSAILVPNDTAVISTIFGPIELKGGAFGAALIDPPQLDMVSNSSTLLLAGANAGANATINAGIFNLAATSGSLSLVNSPAAFAAITANTFNYFGAGNVNLSGGTITATQAGSIDITGLCVNCSTNLFGPFNVRAYVPPPLDYGALVTNDLLALADLGLGLFDAYISEDGTLVLTNRRLNQCY